MNNCQECKSENLEQERADPCSCHIHPPCSACVDAPMVCKDCGHEQECDKPPITPYKGTVYDYKPRTLHDLDRTKIDWISQGHTHFTMIKEGYCPEGTTIEELKKEIDGTFGGRFQSLADSVQEGNGGYFKYVAYTD